MLSALAGSFEKIFGAFWIAAILAFLAGALASMAMAPYHFWPVLFISFSILLALIYYQTSPARHFVLGWLFGFGYFLFSLSWIGNALLVEGNDYAWAWPLAVAGLPALLAFFPALALLAYSWLPRPDKLTGYLTFCLLLGASEYLRGVLFTGFPWNLYGYAWGNHLVLLQVLDLIGPYGLTLGTIFLAALPGYFILARNYITSGIITVLAGAGVFAALFYGQSVLTSHELKVDERVTLKLVQPNIPQSEKWHPDKIAQHFEKLVDMSRPDSAAAPEKTTLIIWPETALHFLYLEDRGARNYLKAMLQDYEGPAFLISGALLYDRTDKTFTNSIITLNKDAELVSRYDKFHLVPFGEYIPFQNWIPLEPVTRFQGFERGPGPQTLSFEESTLPAFSPLVCYEILFPGRVRDIYSDSDFIVNVTNDAWYGDSAGPHQHFLKARFRAIEERRPVIRVANTGITGIIDPKGNILMQTDVFTENIVNGALPLP